VVTTGGTSGVAAAVPFTPEVFDQVTMAMAFRAAILISERQGRPFEMAERIVMIGSVSSRYMGHIILERAGWVNLPATTPLDELVTQLNDLQPDSLSAYASVLVRLAHEQLAGRLRLDLGNLGSSSETLSPDDQELCISAFGVPVRNSYAISELGFVASTIGEDTFLVNEDHFLLEPLDPNLESSAAGQLSDSLAVTSLTNLAFPLIRYQLSDRVAVEPQPWPEYPMAGIRRIAGRTGDWLRIGETEVHPSAISAPLIAHPGVGLWQVQQLPDRLRIQVVATGQEQIDTDQLAAEIGNRLARTDAFAQVAVDVVDEIPTQGHAAKHRSFIPLADG
jgi:phenylacetate-coenzyme A ligase PaaK-like adenylate-forming protein